MKKKKKNIDTRGKYNKTLVIRSPGKDQHMGLHLEHRS